MEASACPAPAGHRAIVVAASLAVGAAAGWLLHRLQPSADSDPHGSGASAPPSRQPRDDYPEFVDVDCMQARVRDAMAAAPTAEIVRYAAGKRDGLRKLGLYRRRRAVTMRCRRVPLDATPGPGQKVVHFMRHGQGYHNFVADFAKRYSVHRRLKGDTYGCNSYNTAENFDPPLTEVGRQQAMARQPEYAQRCKSIGLVVTSPMRRAVETANLAFSHLLGAVPFVAHEGCREGVHGNACDYRRPASQTARDYAGSLDVSLLPEDDPYLSPPRAESKVEGAERTYEFMQWLRARPEDCIVVSTHSCWLFELFNGVLLCEQPEDRGRGLEDWYETGELRSVLVTFEDAGATPQGGS